MNVPPVEVPRAMTSGRIFEPPFTTDVYNLGESISTVTHSSYDNSSNISATKTSGASVGRRPSTNSLSAGEQGTTSATSTQQTGKLAAGTATASVTSAPTDYQKLLPLQFLNKERILQRTVHHLDAFLKQDLDVRRLNRIHGWLWLAGRPQAARPIHRQLMKQRTILVTEQADLHLTWRNSAVFIKPLPRYLFHREIWEDHLCNDPEAYANACGFLLSYTWLVCYKSDFIIATNGDRTIPLLPEGVSWEGWQVFVSELLDSLDFDEFNRSPKTSTMINKRYQYGELRLRNINSIYRLAPLWWYKYLISGYYNEYDKYGTFFSRNFAWLIVVFAYISIVLTAMQVGLAVDNFKHDPRLINASYGFSVFSMVLVVVAIGLGIAVFIFLCVYNLVATAWSHLPKKKPVAGPDKENGGANKT